MRLLLPLLSVCALGCATATVSSSAEPAAALAVPKPAEHHGHDWNAVYRRGAGFTKEPNALLVWAVTGVKPGSALDVGMGQGRNALFLAKQGWQVIGFDPAEEGVRQAKEAAAAAHLTIEARVTDDEHFDMGENTYDLIALIYVGGADLAPKIIKALKPGGLVVAEFFRYDETARFNVPGSFRSGELESVFPGFEVLKSEAVDDVADWSMKPDKLIRFVARKR
jgi:SAM-dependent methyltransferase